MSINLFVASGNVGGDMEVNFTANQKCIGSFSLPVKQGWGDNEKTSWVKCKVLGDRAQKIAEYIKKGTKVTVSGSFVLEQWEKDGVKYSNPVIIVNDLEFTNTSGQQRQQPQQNQAPQQSAPDLDFDDDLPF